MAISEAYAGSASISTTEYSLPANSTTLATVTDDGVYQVFLDLNALTVTEEYLMQVYEKVQSTGTKRVVFAATFLGAQGQPVWVSPSLILLHGWDVTMTKVSGTDRTIEWSIRKVA